MTCGGMGFAGENAIWDYGLQTRGSVRQQLAYLASPFPPEPLKAVQNHLPQRVGVEATVCTAPSNQLGVDWKGRDDGGARRTRAGSKTSSCCRGCRHAILAATHGSGSGAEGCSLLCRKSMYTAYRHHRHQRQAALCQVRPTRPPALPRLCRHSRGDAERHACHEVPVPHMRQRVMAFDAP